MSVAVRRLLLQGKNIRSVAGFYDEFSMRLLLPEHFGRNLDALWDVLSSDVPGPLELVWEDSDVSRGAMGTDFDRIIEVLREVMAERDDFHLTLR